MDMTTLLVTGSTILLVVSKIPDFITTWQGLSITKNPGMEQHPIARWVFEQWGVSFSFYFGFCVFGGGHRFSSSIFSNR